MARKRNRDAAPTAPATVSNSKARRWARLGKRDAKRYGALLDFTPTHSLLRAAGEARRGQHNVNVWLLAQVAPDKSGNQRIAVQRDRFLADRNLLAGDRTTSARAQHQIAARVERLDSALANLEAQRRSNITKVESLIQTADQALGTWETYYSQIAAIYARARANASGQAVSSVGAEIPALDSISLVEIEGFNDEDPGSSRSGGRK